jgi:hypothetical protein
MFLGFDISVKWRQPGLAGFKSSVAFPIGQAIPNGYASNNTDLPYAAAAAEFDAIVTESRALPSSVCTITNSGVLQAERVYSFTSLNTDVAAAFAPLHTLHVLHDPTREPAALTVSATPAATNYWQTVLTQRVTAYNSGVTGFSTLPVIELCNEQVIPGGYASSIFKTAAAADGTWSLASEIGAAVVLYDAMVALGQTHRYAIGESQLEDGGMGVGIDPVPVNHGISRARKRAQMVKWWHDFLAARQFRPIMRMQGHIQAEVPFYQSEFDFFVDELAGMLRIDIGIGELNVTWQNNDQLYADSPTDTIKRNYSASLCGVIAREIHTRAGLNHLIGWTDASSDGLDRMTIMESGALSELGRTLQSTMRTAVTGTAQKRALAPIAFTTAAEAQAIPYWSGITTVSWGAYGTGGAMALDLARFKARTADNGSPAKAPTHNATLVWHGRINAAASGMTLFELKDGSSNVLASAQTTVGGTISVTLQGTTTDLGAYATGDLIKIAIDQNGTTAMRAAMGRYTTATALVQSSVASKSAPAATDAATMTFPETTGNVRTFAVAMYYDTSRLSTDAALLAELNPRPENYLNPTLLAARPVSLSISGTTVPENTAQGTTVGVATPVNSSNPGAVRIVSQTLADALEMASDGLTYVVGSGYAALNYEAVQSFTATFEFVDDVGVHQATQAFTITDVVDGPTTAGAAQTIAAFVGTPRLGTAITGDLDDIIVSPSGRPLSFTVTRGSVGSGNSWTWTPDVLGPITLTFSATDADGQTVIVPFDTTVLAANQAPVAGNVTLTVIVPPPPAAVAPSNTAVPVISGTQKVGNTLSTTSGTWTGDAPITFTYKWQRSNDGSSGWADISGATAATYDLVAADDQKYVRSVVTGTNATGSATANSAASSQIVYDVPTNTVAPTISGNATVGQTLTAVDGTFTPTSTITRKWQNSADGSTGWADIASATSATYVLQAGDQSKYVRCLVTATNSGGSVSTASNVIGAIAAAPSGLVLPPTLLGTAVSQALATQFETGSFATKDTSILLIEVHTVNSVSTTLPTTFNDITIGAAGRAFGTGTSISITPVKQKNASRINTHAFMLLVPASASGQTVQVRLTDASRGTVVRVWEYDGANRTSNPGNTALPTLNGSQTSTPFSFSTANADSAVHYCGCKTYSGVTITITGATDIDQRTSSGTTSSEDIESWSAYEVAATAGTYGMTASWSGSQNQAGVAIEIRKA